MHAVPPSENGKDITHLFFAIYARNNRKIIRGQKGGHSDSQQAGVDIFILLTNFFMLIQTTLKHT